MSQHHGNIEQRTGSESSVSRRPGDLVFILVQDPAQYQYDWGIDKERYIDLLRGAGPV
jgi:hypothetical protein